MTRARFEVRGLAYGDKGQAFEYWLGGDKDS